MAYYLSIDYGGTNTKAIIFNQVGEQISAASFATKKIENEIGHREVELLEAWRSISFAIKEVLSKAHLSGEEIQTVACVGHGKGLYLLDKSGKEFTNGILSTDERGTTLAAQFESQIDEIWHKTRQHVVSVQSPVLLRWFKENIPEIYQNIGYVLAAKDYIRFKLTGNINQEYGDASGNHWINFETATYDKKIFDFFGIQEMQQTLPPIIDYQEVAGVITQQAAKETGLKAGTPVVGGLFDIDACAIGSGVLNEQSFSVISGTWSINSYPAKKPAPLESGQMNSYFPNRDYLVESSSPTAAGNLEYILKMLMSEEIDYLSNHGEQSIYSVTEEFLENTDASFSKVLYFPFLYGSNVDANAKACFFGLTTTTTKSEMVRSVYEGIVFAHKQHIDQLEKTLKNKPVVIRLSGGAANSDQWCQMFADVLAIPVEILEGTELGGLGGAIASLQCSTGCTLEKAVKQMVRVRKKYIPVKSETEKYAIKYEVYQELLNGMTPLWSSLSTLNQKLRTVQ